MNISSDEISNNVTIVVEIGVGFIIAVIVYGISRKSENIIEKKVSGVFNIIKEREEFRKKQEHYIYGLLLNVFNNMQTDAMQILHDAETYEKLKDSSQKEFYKKEIILGCQHIKILAEKNLDNPPIILSEFFDLNTVGTFKTISAVCKNEPKFNEDGKRVNVSFCNSLKKIIEPWINEFNQKLEKTPEKIIEELPIVPISVSLDRTIYPINSTVHLRANIPKTIPDKPILFQIFNNNHELLVEKEIQPEEFEDKQIAPDAGIYEISFKMDNRWKVGEKFQLKGIHGTSVAYDDAVIDQRMPVVQSDKSVYIIGSDMIITVIDPDADKDNQVAEYVGDREDSKLVIESPYGRIDGYRLRETGDSTGIFQGIIGILGIRKNGSVIPQEYNGKIIDKIQGTGIEDGFIGGAPGDELTARYINKAGTAELTFFISNFGAVIELDQKVYQPSDKVYITIVAPDFSSDSDKINEIGRNPESIVNIRTGKDKIEKYQLVETDPGAGIFTGEIQLEQIVPNSKSKGTGPTDGKLLCGDDDFIEVSFRMFDDEEVVGRALIKS